MAKRLSERCRQVLGRHGHVVLVAGLMAVWALLGPRVAAALLLPVWVIVAQLIFLGSFEAARLRRRAWLGQYLVAASPWQRWLRGGLLMALWHQGLAILLALLLLVKLRLLPPVYWPVLLMSLVALVLIQQLLKRRLQRHVIGEYLAALVRRLLVWPAGALLALLLVLTALWLPQPYLVGLGWEEAVIRHTSTAAGDGLLGAFERFGQALELTQFWAMQNALERHGLGQGLILFGWFLLLLTQSAFAWAVVRLAVGADALRDTLGHFRNAGRKDAP
ncbi:hypothetical protein [Billgrantia aerodenitrificans]|uniref:Uncharacterized protein n=1 Tax=Billgrantia aerodenitrificans TaxID=2733483 RepID=A0ABS9AR76_9GAMM|nr:hypothetical protein [Halomonas aerodenitrificans]MCE8024141.1 hypothetical protein [Halomonas aerodenitrificans]